MKNLVIVESPAKAKTIEKFLGKDFTVRSCMGHIRDLSKGDDAINVKQGFKPKYEISADKRDLVKELKKLASAAETVWLATDEDREGEAISWHLCEALGLDASETKRIVFNEITKPAILKAVDNPRVIDKYLVDAQQARRVLDRLVGYELSPVLWRAVRPQLSAGRVQSVAVRLVVEREREINEFQSQSEFRVKAIFSAPDGKTFKAECPKKFKSETEANDFLLKLIGVSHQVLGVEVKPAFRNPAAPFTTSTLQQEASRKLGYDVSRTMQLAQRLYENGHITYMRTDSVNMSPLAINSAKAAIESMFGPKFSQPRNYTTKDENAQEAHEAIRPTYFDKVQAGDDPQQKKLYDLIWKRAIASQMAKAELERTIVQIGNGNTSEIFVAEGEVIQFEGFLKVYIESNDDEEENEQEGLLPKLTKGDKVNPKSIHAEQKFSRPAPRYTEASLVKKLEELGIGRPSTYAPTISTIQKRGYVISDTRDGKKREIVKLELHADAVKRIVESENYGYEKNKLFPTDIGMLVTDFLTTNFDDIMDYGFTASVEKEFDEIAKGMKGWQQMLEGFYESFHSGVEKVSSNIQRVDGERHLGTDPKSGKSVIVRLGRFGPLVQIGDRDDENKQFASLQKEQSMENITLEDALKLFQLPREIGVFQGQTVIAGVGRYGPYLKLGEKFHSVPKGTDLLAMTEQEAADFLTAALSAPQFPLEIGTYEGQNLSVNKGRFGPYIKFGSDFISIPRGVDPTTVNQEKAIELIKAKQESDKSKILKTFTEDAELQIINGRYGPYISYKKGNIPIPKGTDSDQLDYAAVMKIVEKTPAKKAAPAKKAVAKKAPAKKAPVKKKK